jgi:hypothetical protein
MLELKVDKADLENTLSGITKGARRTKRLVALGGVSQSVIDEALPIDDQEAREKAMWKAMSAAMREESEEVIMRQAQRTGGGESSDFSAYMLSKRAQVAARGGMSPNPIGQVGGFRSPSEAGMPGPRSATHTSEGSRPASNNGYAAGFGQPGGPSYPTSSAALPTELYSSTDYPHVPPQGEPQGHDMSFLGAQVAGGGFNQRNNSSLRQGALMPLSSPTVDVEGVGRMVRGKDEKLYYTDESPSTSPTNATAKKMDLMPRQ